MSSDSNTLRKTPSRASSTRTSLFARASEFMKGSRRSHAASEKQADTSSSPDPHPPPSNADDRKEESGNNKKRNSKIGYQEGETTDSAHDDGGVRKFDHIFPIPDKSVKLSPPAPLSDAQQAKYDQMLQHFQSMEEFPTSLKPNSPKKPLDDWEKLRNLSREGMLRYLRATKWDVAAAKKRLTDTIAWRREYGVDSLKAEDLEHEAKTGKETVLGFDNKGRPLHYMHPSRNTTEETPTQMQFAVWILERAIDLMPPGVEMLALLINFGGKKRNPTSISNAKLMLYILQNHYVERLGIALCINVPWIFKAFWNAIYPFIDPVTKAKCKFDEAIKDEVPGPQLATDFGGLLEFPYEHEKYWPQLLELTKKRREEQLERFRTKCNSEIGASEWVIRGGDELDAEQAGEKQESSAEGGEDAPADETDEKKQEAESGAAVAAAAAAAAGASDAATSKPQRGDSSNTDATAVERSTPAYESTEGDLDRFYTSQTELPPQLERQLGGKDASDWENQTAVSDQDGDADASSAQSQQKHPAQKHGDGNVFAAMVSGISHGLHLHKDAHGKAEESHEEPGAEDASELQEKHNHIHSKSLASRNSDSDPRPAPPLSLAAV